MRPIELAVHWRQWKQGREYGRQARGRWAIVERLELASRPSRRRHQSPLDEDHPAQANEHITYAEDVGHRPGLG